MADSSEIAARLAAKRAAKLAPSFSSAPAAVAGSSSGSNSTSGASVGLSNGPKIVATSGLDGTLVRKQVVEDAEAAQAALAQQQNRRIQQLQQGAAAAKENAAKANQLLRGSGQGSAVSQVVRLPSLPSSPSDSHRRLALMMTQSVLANVSEGVSCDPLAVGIASLAGVQLEALQQTLLPFVSPFRDVEKQKSDVLSFLQSCIRGDSGQMFLLVGRHGSGLRSLLGSQMVKAASAAAAIAGQAGLSASSTRAAPQPLLKVCRIGGSVAGKTPYQLLAAIWSQLRRPVASPSVPRGPENRGGWTLPPSSILSQTKPNCDDSLSSSVGATISWAALFENMNEQDTGSPSVSSPFPSSNAASSSASRAEEERNTDATADLQASSASAAPRPSAYVSNDERKRKYANSLFSSASAAANFRTLQQIWSTREAFVATATTGGLSGRFSGSTNMSLSGSTAVSADALQNSVAEVLAPNASASYPLLARFNAASALAQAPAALAYSPSISSSSAHSTASKTESRQSASFNDEKGGLAGHAKEDEAVAEWLAQLGLPGGGGNSRRAQSRSPFYSYLDALVMRAEGGLVGPCKPFASAVADDEVHLRREQGLPPTKRRKLDVPEGGEEKPQRRAERHLVLVDKLRFPHADVGVGSQSSAVNQDGGRYSSPFALLGEALQAKVSKRLSVNFAVDTTKFEDGNDEGEEGEEGEEEEARLAAIGLSSMPHARSAQQPSTSTKVLDPVVQRGKIGLISQQSAGAVSSLSVDAPFQQQGINPTSTFGSSSSSSTVSGVSAAAMASKIMALEHLIEQSLGIGLQAGAQQRAGQPISRGGRDRLSPAAAMSELPVLVVVEDLDGLVKHHSAFFYFLLELRLNSRIPMNVVALSRSYSDLNMVIERRLRSRISGGNGWTPCFVPQPSPLQLSLRLAAILQMPFVQSLSGSRAGSNTSENESELVEAARTFSRRFGEAAIVSLVLRGQQLGLASNVDNSPLPALLPSVAVGVGAVIAAPQALTASLYSHYQASGVKSASEIVTLRACLQALLWSSSSPNLTSAVHSLCRPRFLPAAASSAAASAAFPLIRKERGVFASDPSAPGSFKRPSRDGRLVGTSLVSLWSGPGSTKVGSGGVQKPHPSTALAPATYSIGSGVAISLQSSAAMITLANQGVDELVSLLAALPYPHLLLLAAMAKSELRDSHKQIKTMAANARHGGKGKTSKSASSSHFSSSMMLDAGLNAATFSDESARLPSIPGIAGSSGSASSNSSAAVTYNFTRIYHELRSSFSDGMGGSVFSMTASSASAGAPPSSSSSASSPHLSSSSSTAAASASSFAFVPEKNAALRALEELVYYGLVRLLKAKDGDVAAAVANGGGLSALAAVSGSMSSVDLGALMVGGRGVPAAASMSGAFGNAGAADGNASAAGVSLASARNWDGLQLLSPSSPASSLTNSGTAGLGSRSDFVSGGLVASAQGSSGAGGSLSSSGSTVAATVLADLEHSPCRLNLDAEALIQFFRGEHAAFVFQGLDTRALGFLQAALGTAPTAL